MKDSLEFQVGELLKASNLKLAIAESCTGGLVSNLITDVPGASTYFLGGIVSYTNEAKEKMLDVAPQTLSKYGAVSAETVKEMAKGIRARFSGSVTIDQIIGMSVSGIAGPEGGTPEKPVGLVWIGLSSPKREHAWRFQWDGNRSENKLQSAHAVLIILIQFLKSYLDEKN